MQWIKPVLCGEKSLTEAFSKLIKDQIESDLDLLSMDENRSECFEETVENYVNSLDENSKVLLMGFEQEDPAFLMAFEKFENRLKPENFAAVCGMNLNGIRSAVVFAMQSDTPAQLAERVQAEARASVHLM